LDVIATIISTSLMLRWGAFGDVKSELVSFYIFFLEEFFLFFSEEGL
jgi:hypothetical protein